MGWRRGRERGRLACGGVVGEEVRSGVVFVLVAVRVAERVFGGVVAGSARGR